jgi:hypothetical protein
MRIITCFLLTALLAAAQTSPAPAKRIRLEGMVTNKAGQAIAGATVRLQPPSARVGLTSYVQTGDMEGKFVLEGVVEGRYNLSAQKPGFLTRTIPFDAREGLRLTKLDIKITPESVIAGRVTDQVHKPVVNAHVQVFRSTYVRGRKQLQQMSAVRTNDKGEYRVLSLPAGHYLVAASDQEGINGFSETMPERNVDTFSSPVDVAAGVELRNVDIHMPRSRVYSVSGKAVHPAGASPMGIALILVPKDGVPTTNYAVGLRPDGAFAFVNLLPGTYVVRINQNNPRNVGGRLEVNVVDSNLQNLVFQIVPDAELSGTIRVEDGDLQAILKPQGTPPASPLVLGRGGLAQGPRPSVMLVEADSASNSNRSYPPDADGAFRIQTVKPLNYLLDIVFLPDGTYVKAARYAGQDVTRKAIDLTQGVSGNLEVVLSTKAADLSGAVINDKGEPMVAVSVSLWPKTANPGSPDGGAKTTITDQNGRFRFPSLAPDNYYVAAWEEIEPGLATYSEFLARFNGEASSITLAEGAHASQNPKLIPSTKIVSEAARLP